MSKYLICLLFICRFAMASAQESTVVAKGNKIFVENPSKNENAVKTSEELGLRLNEWAYWNVVDSKANADFILNTEIAASKGITATSWGGTSYSLTAKITDKNGEVLWESNTYKSSPNGTNGFNAGKSVVKKLMRDLKKKFKN